MKCWFEIVNPNFGCFSDDFVDKISVGINASVSPYQLLIDPFFDTNVVCKSIYNLRFVFASVILNAKCVLFCQNKVK